MPKPCAKIICSGKGTFIGERCPGSDDEEEKESHHCDDCGSLWRSDSSVVCSICNAYWCSDYHDFCIKLDCPTIMNGRVEYACSSCFLSRKRYQCEQSDCPCSQKVKTALVVNEYYRQSGIPIGTLEMKKVDDESSKSTWCFEAYSLRTQDKYRYREFVDSFKEDEGEFSRSGEIGRHLRGLVKNRHKLGYRISDQTGIFEGTSYHDVIPRISND